MLLHCRLSSVGWQRRPNSKTGFWSTENTKEKTHGDMDMENGTWIHGIKILGNSKVSGKKSNRNG
jgi:hypothetical protein